MVRENTEGAAEERKKKENRKDQKREYLKGKPHREVISTQWSRGARAEESSEVVSSCCESNTRHAAKLKLACFPYKQGKSFTNVGKNPRFTMMG